MTTTANTGQRTRRATDETTNRALTRSRFRRLAEVSELGDRITVVEAQARSIKATLLTLQLMAGGYSVAEAIALPPEERARIAMRAQVIDPTPTTWAWAINSLDAVQDRARR